MKVLFLPVDSRPCNWLFPKQLLEWAGAECILPSPEVQDHFTRPSDWAGIQAFLTAHAAEADVWALSLDQLCFGSLLASRDDKISEEEALRRLDWFEQLRAQYPEKPVHAVNTILRTSISALSSRDLNVYRAMTEYSYWSDKADMSGSMEEMARAERAARMIPTELILKYHNVRARNHLVNARAVDLVKKGVLNSALLLMEDSEEYGFHRAEQRALQEQIGDDPRVMIKNGTDEGPMLGMKCLMPENTDLSIAVEWIGRTDGNFIAKYEDRPFAENVDRCLQYIGIRKDPEADIVLAIACQSEGVQMDLVSATSLPSYEREEKLAADRINDLLATEKRVYLLDQFCCNGGWVDFFKRIEHPERLMGYSAWNTASNALGTIVGQICSDVLAGKPNLCFRNERFLDDLLYEACVRSQLNHTLRAYGQDPYHLTEPGSSEHLLRMLFDQLFAQEEGWTHRFAPVIACLKEGGDYTISFPWERTFEAEAHYMPINAK